MAKYGTAVYGTVSGATAADIKNLALATLGFVDVLDFTSTTDATVAKVNRIYPTTLQWVLANYPWRFCLKRVQLTSRTDATSGNYKFKYLYTLPSDILAIRTLYHDSGYRSPIAEYDSHPGYVNTDASTVYLWYTALVDEGMFPRYFIDYFKLKLALDLCFLLTGDTELMKLLAVQEEKSLLLTKNIDAKQNQVRSIRSSPYTAIRR